MKRSLPVVLSVIVVAVAYGVTIAVIRLGDDGPKRTASHERVSVRRHAENGRQIVTATVDQKAVGEIDDDDLAGTVHRRAKHLWRTDRGRMDVLDLTVRLKSENDGGSRYERWTRKRLDRTFGTRPAGLDAGGAAADPAPATVRPLAAPNGAASATARWLRHLLAGTVEGPLKGALAEWTADQSKCLTGDDHNGPRNPTGKVRHTVRVSVTLPAGKHAESIELPVARHWARLGLRVHTRSEPDGGFQRVWVFSTSGDYLSLHTQQPPNVRVPASRVEITAFTGCRPPS